MRTTAAVIEIHQSIMKLYRIDNRVTLYVLLYDLHKLEPNVRTKHLPFFYMQKIIFDFREKQKKKNPLADISL